MGEGSHFYKIDGKYYIISAWYAGAHAHAGRARRPASTGRTRSTRRSAPTRISACAKAQRLTRQRQAADSSSTRRPDAARGRMSMHQGGIVQTPAGEWWGFSMMDCNSVGRLTGAVAGHVEGRLAVLRPAGQPRRARRAPG